jgi:hypothetical protein
MKALRIARSVLLVVAATLVGLALVLSATGDGALLTYVHASVSSLGIAIAFALLILGTALLFSKNNIASMVGMSLSVSIYVVLALPLLMGGEGTDIILPFVASIVFAISWLIHLLYIVSVHSRKE